MKIIILALAAIILFLSAGLVIYHFKYNGLVFNQISKHEDTPFMIVAKLTSAEAVLDFEAGKKYIDLERAYPEAKANSETPEELWERVCIRRHNLGKPGSKNAYRYIFKYYRWNIQEILYDDNTSKVIFISPHNPILKIMYGLEKRGKDWIVVSIEYHGFPVVDSDIMYAF